MGDKREKGGGEIREDRSKKDIGAISSCSEVVERVLTEDEKRASFESKKNLLNRLEIDLLQDKTADYRRINFTEMFVFFATDSRLTTTHWRLAKIMDAWVFCNKEMGILDEGLSYSEVATKIYGQLLKGGANEECLTISLPDSKKKKKVSLADIAYFYDTVQTNRRLGVGRLSMEDVAEKFFGGEKSGSQPIEVNLDGGKKIDLINGDNESFSGKEDDFCRKINPRDDYSDITDDLKDYIEFIKKNQHRAELNVHWRFNSEGHRELGGHMSMVSLDGELCYVPMSGRLAARITLEDLQKTEKGGLTGQPQEVGEMDEEETGAIIRFNLVDLQQRRKGGDARNITITQRLAKAMMGLTLGDDAYKQIGTVSDKENIGKEKKQINLCGKYSGGSFELDGDCSVIKGIMTHYNRSFKKMRGREMSKEEAADVALLDVFAPCILNNPNDWLLALAKTYGLSGGPALLNRAKTSFGEFEIVLFGRDKNNLKDGKVVANTFTNMTDLWNYIIERASLGHLDQPTALIGGLTQRFELGGKEEGKDILDMDVVERYTLKSIDNEKGRDFGSAMREVLRDYASSSLDQYRENGLGFNSFEMVVNGKYVLPSEKIEGRKKMPFKNNLKTLLFSLDDGEKINFVAQVFFSGDVREAEDAIGGSIDSVIVGFLDTLANLNDKDRQKIK